MVERLRHVVRRVLGETDTSSEITADADLRNVGINSLKLIGLILELESEFCVKFPDEMLTAETFRTLRDIETAVAYLQVQ